MSRVSLCSVGDKPHVLWLDRDPDGGHAAALRQTLGGPVACLPLHDGMQLCCNRGGLVFGLVLARRVLAIGCGLEIDVPHFDRALFAWMIPRRTKCCTGVAVTVYAGWLCECG